MSKYCLREESKELLKKLRIELKISESCYFSIPDKCSSKTNMLDCFRQIFSLSLEDMQRVSWLIQENRRGFGIEESRSESDKSCKYLNLNAIEDLIIHQLLKKNGVLVKSEEEDKILSKEDNEFYRTSDLFKKNCNSLIGKGYIFKFQFSDYDILYLLNPELLECARK